MKQQTYFLSCFPAMLNASPICQKYLSVLAGLPNFSLHKILLWLLLAGVSCFIQPQGLQAQQEDTLAGDFFIKRLNKSAQPEIEGADGEDGDEKDMPANKFRRARLMPGKVKLWNNQAFIKGGDLNISVDDDETPPIMAMSASGACALPIVDSDLEPVYESVKAHMPLYVPYRHAKVGIWQGFYYNWDKIHGAIDYGRGGIEAGDDPTFGVYAVAEGEVVDVGWSNGGGNFIKIEHTAPNGFKYLSSYIHLRNGFSNDLEKAKNTSGKYQKFAKLANPSKLCWGTEHQKIKVKKGQKVKAGQFLAWAGNTGSGGIGIILDDDGKLKNSNTKSFNVHLHFTLYVKDTRPGKSGWVKIDPYGVYNKKSGIDCYDLDDETPYVRLFAPFYPNFHNISLEVVNKYWGYYTGMGMALQTISIDRANGKLLASGSFQWGLPKAWYARFYMKADTYQSYFNQYADKGFRPRHIQVTNDSKGNPRFTVIWEKKVSGQSSFAFHNRTDADFDKLWDDYFKKKKWHLSEHVTYTSDGKLFHAGIFVNKPADNGFYMYFGLPSGDFNKKFDELANTNKWQLVSMHVNNNKIGGVWRPKTDNYAALYGLSAAEYQDKFDAYSKKGMRLYKIQSYANSSRFAAIWVR